MKVTKMLKRETGKDYVVSQVLPTSKSKINSHINLFNYSLPESFLEATQVITIDMNDVNYLTLVDTDGTTISDIGRGLLGEAISKQLVAPDISSLTYTNSRDTTISSALKQPTTVSVLPPTSVDLSSAVKSSTATLLPPAMPPTSISA